jgi:hypothetical protein
MSLHNSIENVDHYIKLQNINNVIYSKEKQKFKTKYNFQWIEVIDAPPLNNSIETLADLNYLSRITNSRSEQENNLILLVDKDPKLLFIDLLKRHNLKFPEDLFNSIYDVLEPYIVEVKQHFNRARPKQIGDLLGKTINVLETKTHHTPAYPSGHTCYAKLCAILCSERYPHLKSDFTDIVNLVAYCRELQGVHYTSDNQASLILTAFVYEKLQNLTT